MIKSWRVSIGLGSCVFWLFFWGCTPRASRPDPVLPPPPSSSEVQLSLSPQSLPRGGRLRLQAQPAADLEVYLMPNPVPIAKASGTELFIETEGLHVGTQSLRIRYRAKGTSSWNESTHRILILAFQAPAAYTYQLQATYDHNSEAFTQGLQLENGVMYEGTGERGSSYVERLSWPHGESLVRRSLEDEFFGEGIALYGDTLYQLSWQAHQGFIYNKESLKPLGGFNYSTEGWGLTRWKDYLLLSDGSEYIYVYEPWPWTLSHALQVYDHEGPIERINELEAVGDTLYANQWGESHLLVINLKNGELIARLDLASLFDSRTYNAENGTRAEVLNGIAYDAASGNLIVTGKRWPYLYEIRVHKPPSP